MSERSRAVTSLPPEQQAIRDKCFHPSGTFVEFPKEEIEQSIPERFEKIASLYPDRIAVKASNKTLTYEQLNRAANLVAHAILSQCGRGVEPITLLIEHSASVIVAILGVLKAGKFYVPLDPSHPRARTSYIFEATQAGLVVTNSRNLRLATELSKGGCRVLDIDNLVPGLCAENPSVSISPDTYAYVLYTSGSTGQPKGVIQNHRNLLHKVMVISNSFHICPADRLTLLHSCGFSASVDNLFGALLNGASLLPFNIKEEGLNNLVKWLIQEEITIYNSVTSVFRHLVNTLTGEEKFPKIRLFKIGAEQVTKDDFDLYKKIFSPDCIFVAGLGSNETGRTRLYFIDKATEILGNTVPTGYAVPDKDILLLDESGKEVGVNRVGEIVVKSSYMSPGYWRRPDLTRAAFLPDPEGGDKRIYLTGDLGLLLPDSCLMVRGRKDFQVKIRGQRVEVAEIEIALRELDTVKDVVVAAWDVQSDDKRLVAYVVPARQSRPAARKLRGVLLKKLPEYMVPSNFVFLDALPLTTNGKVDRRALPEPGKARLDLDTEYVAPRTPIEVELTKIWAEVLYLNRVGVHDHFFDLGGHSLLAMRILSAVNDAFAVEVSMSGLLDAPTVAKLAEQIELLRAIGDHTNPALSNQHRPIITASGRHGALPLSYAEEGLWLIEQIRPGMSAWNMQSRLRLRGSLKVEALRRSLNTLIQRHETLRTAYRIVNGEPVRVIMPVLTVELPTCQLDPSLETDAEINRISIETEKQPFDLAEAPLFRARFVRVNELDHLLIVTNHHIITDAWSSHVFIRELFALYDAYANGRSSPLAELPVQYSDYALWVRQSGQEHMANQLSYWREKLKGCVVQEIPTDKRRPLERSYRGGRERVRLSNERSRALGELCKAERATLFMLLVAAFKTLLSRYTGSTDIVVGSALAGRSRPELENLLGMFINILTLRTDLSGELTFRELLGRVRETCLEAYQHQDMPFEKLVEELNPGRDLNRNPFFQVLFNVVNVPSTLRLVDGLAIELLPRPDDTSRFDLTLYAPHTHDGIEIIAAYNRSLFFTDRIVEMLEQYKYLLEQIVDNPDREIDQYSLVTPAAERLLPDPTVPLDDTWQGAVHELITRQAKRLPDKITVKDWQEAWTYRELDQRSNQLARYLLAQGIGREDVVVLYGPTSGSLVWALMGTLKAGAAFFMLDPAHPAQRLKDCLDLLQPKALIQFGSASNLSPGLEDTLTAPALKCRVTLPPLAVAKATEFLSEYLPGDPKMPVGADDLAYVIFTSGTTGTPKGVTGRHGPLTHFLPWVQEAFQVSADDRFTVLAGLSSNILQREIFTSLSIGGTLHIPNPDYIGNLGKLDAWMKNEAVSVVHLTPALAQLIYDTSSQPIQSVRRIFFAGDLLKLGDVDKARKLMPNAEVVNFYNSSESQRAGGYNVVPGQRNGSEKETVPLGRGIKDVQLLVLNRNGQLAGVGEQGEICVRSPHLARGYLGDEALTNERFITNPFTGVEGDRIYRTGELGRYLPDGNVGFVARAENQVSIRGFRVELGEIESVLKNHDSISNAVVSLHENSSDRLIAHLVPNAGASLSLDEIRVFLRARLPTYMIPAAFIICDSLPLTPTGKIDRRRVAAVDLDKLDQPSMFVAPRTPIEESLAEIWGKVLNLNRVGIHNNFFDLGGHSLFAVQVVSRLREVFGVDLPLRVIFEAPTVAEMAAIITPNQAKQASEAELAQMLSEVEAMTEEEARKQLAGERVRSSSRDRNE